jgi:hypothetical protein
MAESLLQLGGAPPAKQYKSVPLTTSLFFSGLYTQRSPFGSPDGRYYSKVLGGRTDILIDGLNTELTNYGTLIRRPGTQSYSSVSLGSTPLTFYSFHQLGNLLNPIQVIADTTTNVYSLTPSSKTNILTKSMGSGQSYFQGIGNTLYIGDGIDLQAWPGSGATRNWGITMNNTANTTGPNACGTGTDVAVVSGTGWTNPGNITVNDGNFAIVTLPPPAGGSATAGPNAPTLAASVGSGKVWTNVNNIKIQDGSDATTSLLVGQTSQELQGTGYNFGVPANATINGITVVIWYSSGNVTHGGAADLWGASWTPSDINNSGFGVQVSVTNAGGGEIDETDVTLLKAGVATGNNKGNTTFVAAAVDFISISVTYTIPVGTTSVTDLLEATNFGFGLSLVNTISGVLVEIKGIQTGNPAGSDILVSILKNGSQVGTIKAGQLSEAVNAFVSFGGVGDLWGTTFSPGDINSATFGISIQGNNSGSANAIWNVDFVRITIYGTGGPSVSTTGSGTFNALFGYQYVFAYGNSNSGQVSNPTPPSANTGKFGGVISTTVLANAGTGYAANDTGVVSAGNFDATYKVLTVSAGNVLTYSITSAGTGYATANNVGTARAGTQPGAGVGFAINITAVTGVASVQVVITASTDPQVNQIRVFRTKDGGSTFFELPSSPYPNTSTTISDSASDTSLTATTPQFPFSPWLANSPPPAGLVKMTYHLNRMWGVVNNNVYYSALLGDDITIGVGVESWPPSNVFVFPTTVNRLMPIASGILVFTTDDIYLISGTTRASLFSQLFQQGVGLLSWNALDVEGNQIFLYTSDRQFITFTASGPMETGYPIGVDLQTNFNPSNVYVAALVAGTQDKAVFVADGTSDWYRCNWNQPPEGGPSWSPLATIVGGATAVVSVETSPGVHQLLIGQSNGTVLVRNYSVFSDNSTPYSAFATIGSLVLAKPGQLALLDSIVVELQNRGTPPSVSLLLDEISGTFEQLVKAENDPPNLAPSQTVMSKRWWLSQGNLPAFCRHIQLKLSFVTEAVKNEVLTVTEIGSLVQEK